MAISGKGQAAIVAAGAAVLAAVLAVFGLPPARTPPSGTPTQPAPQQTAISGQPATSGEKAPAPAGTSADARAPSDSSQPLAIAGGEAPASPIPAGQSATGNSVIGNSVTGQSPATQPVAAPGQEALRQVPMPSFDVVRVGPEGDSVVAGRVTPGSAVELLVNGRVHDRAEAQNSGAFALTPPPLPPGDHELTLREIAGDGKVTESRQSVTVVIAGDRRSPPVVALAEPDRPTLVLSGPGINGAAGNGQTAPAGADGKQEATPPPSAVSVTTVEAEAGRLYVSGQAPPGSSVRLYLNDSYLAAAKASPAGQLAFSIGSGLGDGDYRVRLDEVAPGSATVVSRAEVPFEMDGTRLAAPGEAPALTGQADGAAGDASHVVVPEVRTTRVERGDSLWRISRRVYGQGTRYTVIYGANQNQIRNPNLIYPGQLFVLPGDPENPVVVQ
ncbi:LysM peptidoglycan-binding domain-containing protein [Pseudochelatococcus lubricantis]|uniref:LysM peptidoglycan-binding domain-containing protein n=1 Tax=Pseudochelatococcus lubricantis TaxID=1538102 RepID=UPI0035EBC43B